MMTLDQVHQISEILAAVVVAVTLIFLTIQLKQNTMMLRSSATQGAHDAMSDIYHPLMADASLTELWLRGLQDTSQLSKVEIARFFSFWLQPMFVLQNWYLQIQEGLLDEKVLDSFGQVVANLHHVAPGFNEFWDQRKYVYTPEFIRFVEDDLFNRDVTPGYRPLGAPEE